MALSTSSSQSQTTTQSPHAGVQSLNSTTQSSSVQPGTTTGLLNGSGSVALHPTNLTSINLSTAQPTTAPAIATTVKHHTNPVFFGLAIVLFVLAVVLFWLTGRSGKRGII